jgi:hypothetical protein
MMNSLARIYRFYVLGLYLNLGLETEKTDRD